MEPTIPWYQSAIVRQQIAQLVLALTAIFGVNLGGLDVDATLVAIFGGIGGVIAVWTIITRIFKPAPNLSQTAVDKEIELVNARKIPPSPTGPQRGFVTLRGLCAVLIVAANIALLPFVMTGCTGTRAAYGEARTGATAVLDTAYVVTEHYAAIVREAADLAQRPGIPADVKESLKRADAAVKPLVTGDPATGRAGVRQLAQTYEAVRSAENEQQLQAAINAAVLELSKLINAVKAARRNP